MIAVKIGKLNVPGDTKLDFAVICHAGNKTVRAKMSQLKMEM